MEKEEKQTLWVKISPLPGRAKPKPEITAGEKKERKGKKKKRTGDRSKRKTQKDICGCGSTTNQDSWKGLVLDYRLPTT